MLRASVVRRANLPRAIAVPAWSAAVSAVALLICRFTVGLRATPEAIEDGLDLSAHGERAYQS